MISSIQHIGITVQQIERAIAFLEQAAGFVPVPDDRMNGLHATAARSMLLRGPRCMIELLQYEHREQPSYHPVSDAGITHFCVQTNQIEPLYQRFATAGATFHATPLQLATGNRYCYARDPEGNVIELEALPDAPANQAPWIAHVALATPDVARLATFYHHILGGARAGGQQIGPNPLYDALTGLTDMRVVPAWIIGANITIELWQFLQPATLAPPQPRAFAALGYNHICFEVANLPTALAALEAAGASCPSEIYRTTGVASATIRDPDGNWLELTAIEETLQYKGF